MTQGTVRSPASVKLRGYATASMNAELMTTSRLRPNTHITYSNGTIKLFHGGRELLRITSCPWRNHRYRRVRGVYLQRLGHSCSEPYLTIYLFRRMVIGTIYRSIALSSLVSRSLRKLLKSESTLINPPEHFETTLPCDISQGRD